MRARLFVAAAIAVVVACNERFPREDVRVPPPSPETPASGLDARPTGSRCAARGAAQSTARVGFTKLATPPFTRPIEIVAHGGRLYVLEQAGLLRAIEADEKTVSLVADLRPAIGATGSGESGLLGLAFHPSFDQNGFVYVYYTAPGGAVFQSVLARFESKDGGATLDLSTEKKLLVVDQPYGNHNGATIAFGNDGFLYWGLGDGGSGGDPQNRAQDESSLFGKILRIDVDGGDPYAIPPDNPFAAGGGLPEIYALGFRNPYRFRFDRPTGDLWVGDVGQSAREEIDKVVLGGNYGWRIREGKTCYQPNPCDATGLIDPVVDHDRSEAQSIIGGVVYRGTALPGLAGHYIYSDLGSAIYFGFPADDPAPVPIRLFEPVPDRIDPTAISLDGDGEIVVAEYSSGIIWRMTAPAPPEEVPSLLSETGCLDLEGTFPYDVVVPQWLDGRTAVRALSIPEEARLEVVGDRLSMPPGSVAIRTIMDGERKIETQLLTVRDGEVGAYAYTWSEDQKDAALRAGAETECFTCHDGRARPLTIGLDLRQLDRDFAFPGGRTGNVLATLDAVGMLSAKVDPTATTALSALDGQAPAALRARSYLHANCAFCHAGPDGRRPYLSLDADVTAGDACAGASRMRRTDSGRMPPVGSVMVHEEAAAVIEQWAREGGTSCP